VNGGSTSFSSLSDTFLLMVNPVDDAPTITAIGSQSIPAGTATAAIPFTISDVETAAGALTLSGVSSTPSLVPSGNIAFGGSGANRTVTVTPAAGQSGSCTITVTVGDGALTASSGFSLLVQAAPPAAATLAVSGITATGATLNGTVNANGASTATSFEYGLTSSYGTSVNASPSMVSGTAATAVHAVLTNLIPATTYHCRVVGVNVGGTGFGNGVTFTTDGSTVALAAVETEPNDTPATAMALAGTGAGVKVSGNIFPVADADFYSFSAQEGDRIYAALMTAISPSSFDSQLRILGSDGMTVLELDEDDGSFGSTSSSIAGITVPASGTYFVKVNEKTGAGTIRPYELYVRVRSGAPASETEPNNTFPGQVLPQSGWVSGNIVTLTDDDYYSVSLNAGDTVFASLDLDPERDGSTWDGWVGFGRLGSPGQTLVSSDPGVVSPNSEAFFMTVKDAGTYAIFVGAQSGGTTVGTYHLSVTIVPSALETSTTYASVNVPQSVPDGSGQVASSITIPDSKRIGRLKVFLNLTHAYMQDLDVQLTSPDGNTVGLFTDIGSTNAGEQVEMNLGLDDLAGLPPIYTAVSGAIFKPEGRYRLDWFKGQQAQGTWTLTLRDDTAIDVGTLNGWSLEVVDEAPPPSGTPVIHYNDDFESGDGGFTHSGTGDEWQRGLPTSTPIITASSGSNCWKTDLSGTYNAGGSQDLFSPNIDLTGVPPSASVVFSWAMKFQIESATYDHAFVEVQEVGGTGATRKVWEWLGPTMTDSVGNPAAAIHEAAGWGRHHALLTGFSGKTIRLRFHLDSDSEVQLAGLAIDDVSVISYGGGSQSPPSVVTLSASSITGTQAVLNGTLNANGASASAVFEYGLTNGYGASADASPFTVVGSAVTAVSAVITGLTPNTTYHFRVKGVNSGGSGQGADAIFTTLNNDANLSMLTMSGGTLDPAFSSGTLGYSATVPNSTASITVTPVANVASSTIQVRINGGAYHNVVSGNPSGVLALNVGPNPVEVRVTAQDGTTTRLYSVSLTRSLPAAGLFTRITSGQVAANTASSVAGTWGDYDGDGDLDLYVTRAFDNFGPSTTAQLFRNDGGGGVHPRHRRRCGDSGAHIHGRRRVGGLRQ
jgi:subtilisin-like proprotein convertase family protein